MPEVRAVPVISALTDLLDEDVYSNAGHVTVSPSTTPGARALAAEINEGRTCADALRALLDAVGDSESVVTGLIEIALSHNGAGGRGSPSEATSGSERSGVRRPVSSLAAKE